MFPAHPLPAFCGTCTAGGRLAALTIVGVLALLIGFPAAASAADAVTVNVLQSTPDRIVIQYQFDDFTQGTVRIGDRPYAQIFLGSESLKMEEGAPALPDVSRSIIIPDDKQMSVSVLSSSSYEIRDIDIEPSKGSILRTVDPATVRHTFGGVYQRDELFPGALATLRKPYILRDHRGIVVTVHPFQYNPVQRLLNVYTEITVEVVPAGPGSINVLRRPSRPRALVRSFHELYGAHFINYGFGARYTPLVEDGEMLIIVHDAWLNNVQALTDHKNGIGINTSMVGVSMIGNNSASIMGYIQDLYNSSDLAFVLLVGDGAQVASPWASGGSSDPSYAKLAGSDDYPEILVGRFSAETAAQVDTQVERTIEYENMPATEQDWCWRGMGIASNQGPGDDGEMDTEHVDNIRLDLLAHGYTEVDQIYDPYATSGMVADGLNAGRGIINYTGHGSTTSWGSSGFSNSDINALVNDNMLPWIVTVACVNGDFDGPTCFAEAWLRATNGSTGAATGAIGIYASSINQFWSEPMASQDETVDRFVDETYSCYGTLCFAGSCQMMDEYASSGVTMFDTWIVFGDPSLRVVGTVAPPTGMKVSPSSGLTSEGPNGGPFTPASQIYTLTNHDPVPLDFLVTKSAPWIGLSDTSGTIPVGGSADVTVSISSLADNLGNGHYEANVDFVNATNSDGDTTRLVSLDVGVPQPVHLFDMNTNPGWSMTGEWAHGGPTGQGGAMFGLPDPSSGATATDVCGVNLYGDYSTSTGGPYYLTTTPIDCSSLTQVSLRFQRWLNTDYQPFVSATLEASNDGSNWVSLWENGNSEIVASSWSEQVHDISAVADQQATVYVRWGYEVGPGAWAYSGWNIDDIEIWGIAPTGGCDAFQRGDANNDAVIDISDPIHLLQYLFGSGGTVLSCADAADGNDDGHLNIADAMAMLSSLFGSGGSLPPPAGACGVDPTADSLGCEVPMNCCP